MFEKKFKIKSEFEPAGVRNGVGPISQGRSLTRRGEEWAGTLSARLIVIFAKNPMSGQFRYGRVENFFSKKRFLTNLYI